MILLLFSAGSFLSVCSQPRLEIGALYGLPRYDDFFRYEFESRLGYQMGFSYQRSDGIVIGANLDVLSFRPYSANFAGISEVAYRGYNIQISYAGKKSEKARLEPFAGTGYGTMNYNRGALKSQAFLLKLGAVFIWKPEDSYGLTISMSWLGYFDKFGKGLNSLESQHTQLILISAGFFIWP